MENYNLQLISLLDTASTEELLNKIYDEQGIFYVGDIYYFDKKGKKSNLLYDYTYAENTNYLLDEYLVFCHPVMQNVIGNTLNKPVTFLYSESNAAKRKNSLAFSGNINNLDTFYYTKKGFYFQIDRVSMLELKVAKLEIALSEDKDRIVQWRSKNNTLCNFTYTEFLEFVEEASRFKEAALKITWKMMDYEKANNGNNITITYSS